MQALSNHPDQALANFVLRGIQTGFRIGFDHAHQAARLKSARKNLKSAQDNPTVVQEYIDAEVQAGRLVPLPAHTDQDRIHVSPFGVIPKRHQPGKWRLIVDLSSPKGHSVNDGISESLCSLRYPSVHDGARMARALGKGALLAKLDLKNAYRIIPVHPDDRWLLGVRWQGQTLLDAALPFGLRSAPKLFTAVADCLLWIMQANGIQLALHYLDDFLFIGKPDSPQCANSLRTAIDICTHLGVPIATNKIEGPSTSLSFLVIVIDTESFQLKLPSEKLQRLKVDIAKWQGRRRCTRRELQSLLGSLNHAASVIGPGRTFMRGLIESLSKAAAPHHHIRLSAVAKADLQWWSIFMEQWNGISYLPPPTPSIHIYSDASGSWGCGAIWSQAWLQIQWPPEWHSENIATKELVPIVAAAATWGSQWQFQAIRCHCDNIAVVSAINSGRAKFPPVNRLLRCLFFFAAQFNFGLTAEHIKGSQNQPADAISRNYTISTHFQLNPSPQPMPKDLLQILLDRPLLWSSPRWRALSSTCLAKAWQPPHAEPTHQPVGAT